MQQHPLEVAIQQLGLSVEATFIPFSQSRNKADKLPMLNWTVTLRRQGKDANTGEPCGPIKDLFSTDYGAGMAHCPSYNKPAPASWDRPKRDWQPIVCAWECENGFEARHDSFRGFMKATANVPVAPLLSKSVHVAIKPKTADVVQSLLADASVLDSGGFEDWAVELGYDPDSRKAEATYRSCLEIALKLRNSIGEEGMQMLQAAAMDY